MIKVTCADIITNLAHNQKWHSQEVSFAYWFKAMNVVPEKMQWHARELNTKEGILGGKRGEVTVKSERNNEWGEMSINLQYVSTTAMLGTACNEMIEWY